MDQEFCKVGVVKSDTLSECSSYAQTPAGINGPLTGKIPVVIAEPLIQIVVESRIELKEPALEIKRIKKNLFIDQCKLIDLGCLNTGKLFLGGYVRKNIEYATLGYVCNQYKSISGDIRHTTVNVPFTCVTQINYITPPKLCYQDNPKELSLNLDCINGKDSCNCATVGRYPCEQSFEHTEYFNEKVFCELEEARFYENDIHEGSSHVGCEFPSEKTFDCLTEKMVILVKVKILQKQQVNIPGKHLDYDGKMKIKYK